MTAGRAAPVRGLRAGARGPRVVAPAEAGTLGPEGGRVRGRVCSEGGKDKRARSFLCRPPSWAVMGSGEETPERGLGAAGRLTDGGACAPTAGSLVGASLPDQPKRRGAARGSQGFSRPGSRG